MEAQTKYGIGASAVLTIAGFAAPLFGWWVSGPIMLFCTMVALWGFAPLVGVGAFTWPRGRVPLLEAATKAYEATKDNDIGYAATELSNDPDAVLTWYCNYLTRTGAQPRLSLYGNQPPSRAIDLIPIDPLNSFDFMVENGAILLQRRNSRDRYENLSVDRKALTAAIRRISAWSLSEA